MGKLLKKKSLKILKLFSDITTSKFDEYYSKKYNEIISKLKQNGVENEEIYLDYACEIANMYAERMLNKEEENSL